MASTKKNKQYDHDYEWNGNASPVKGVNLAEKNPWNKPGWNTILTSTSSPQPKSPDHRAVEQKPTDWQTLQDQHQWQTPDWATVKQSQSTKQNPQHVAIVKDPVPRPMLKKTSVGSGAAAGGGGSRGSAKQSQSGTTSSIDLAEAEIAEMERRIEEATRKKAAMVAAQQQQVAHEEAERQRHTVNETALERARREAKEREEKRWRATLQERNARDKERREQARLQALALSHKTRDDASWQTPTSSPTKQRSSEPTRNVQSGMLDPAVATTLSPLVDDHQTQRQLQTSANQQPAEVQDDVDDEYVEEEEYYEEEEEEVDDEEYEEEEIVEAGEDVTARNNDNATSAELQRQIDALRRQLAAVST